MNESFVFYRSFHEAAEGLNDEQYGKIMRLLAEYALNGTEPEEMDAVTKLAFTLMKPQIDANSRRRENGSKGGKPKNSEPNSNQNVTESEPNSNQNVTKAEPNSNQSVTESEPNVNANVNVNANANVNNNARAREEGLETADLKVKVRKSLNEYFDTLEKLNQRPLTMAKRQNIVKKLLSISQDEHRQLELIDTAIKNGWQNVYSENSKAEAKKERFGIQRSNDLDKLIAAQTAASIEGG